MPLTKTGQEVLGKMKKKYGDKKGEQVFYASINADKSGSEDWHREKKGSDLWVLGHRGVR
jgi:hypothetical protein